MKRISLGELVYGPGFIVVGIYGVVLNWPPVVEVCWRLLWLAAASHLALRLPSPFLHKLALAIAGLLLGCLGPGVPGFGNNVSIMFLGVALAIGIAMAVSKKLPAINAFRIPPRRNVIPLILALTVLGYGAVALVTSATLGFSEPARAFGLSVMAAVALAGLRMTVFRE